MDPKKQELNPELKQIYDRVMNTQVGSKPSAAAPATPPPTQPQTPVKSPPAQTIPQPAAPHPLSEPKAFVFTGNKIITPQGKTHPDTHVAGSKKGLSGKIIAILVVILVTAWGALWAKIFALF